MGVMACAEEPEAPVPAPQPEAVAPRPATFPTTVAPAWPVRPAAPVPRAMPAPPPNVIGEYRVGHIHEPRLAHIFQYSSYNPYFDQLTRPFRATIYGTRHARYYTTYRTLYTSPQWHTMYLPSAPYCPPGETQPTVAIDPRARAPYGPGSATYFGAYGY